MPHHYQLLNRRPWTSATEEDNWDNSLKRSQGTAPCGSFCRYLYLQLTRRPASIMRRLSATDHTDCRIEISDILGQFLDRRLVNMVTIHQSVTAFYKASWHEENFTQVIDSERQRNQSDRIQHANHLLIPNGLVSTWSNPSQPFSGEPPLFHSSQTRR